jgi:hypothetical protein
MFAPCAAAVVALSCSAASAGSVHFHPKPEHLSPAAALKFYEHEVVLRDAAPEKFDRVHPLAGRLLTSEAVYEELLAKWEAHPARFEHNHECLWRLVYGDLIYHEQHPPPSSPSTPPITAITLHDDVPPGPGNPGGNNPWNPPPNEFHGASVPEPSAGVLLGSGLIFVALAAVRRRSLSRRKPAQPE